MESWKPVAESNGRYEVSDRGNVRSAKLRNGHKPKALKPWTTGRKNAQGYARVALSLPTGVVYRLVHRLVAAAFLGNPNGKEQVNHKSGDTMDNTLGNLEWVTNQENARHAADVLGRKPWIAGKRGTQPNSKRVELERDGVKAVFPSTGAAAEYIGCQQTHVSKAARGEVKSVHGWVARYVV